MVAKTLDSAERFGKCLVVLALAALPWAASNAASAQEWSQVSQETLDKYLFSPNPGGPATGAGTLRWESDMVLDFYAADGRKYLQQLVDDINDRGLMGSRTVFLPPPGSVKADQGRFDFAVGVSGDFFDLLLGGGTPATPGDRAYQARAKQSGCFAQPRVRKAASVISNGRLMARDDLKKAKLNDCLLRGLLRNAGLMNTQTLGIRDEPLSDGEREEAYSVLKLLYHPSVRAGMSREEVSNALKSEGLISQ